jgi:hypothetical protein
LKTAMLVSSIAALVAAMAVSVTVHTRDRTPPTLDDLCSSAAAPFGTMIVNVDVVENDSPTEPGEASVFYSTDNQASWTEILLAQAAGMIGGTWEASFPIDSGDVHYYFVVHDDSSAAFGSPVNSTDEYPPPTNLLAQTDDEHAGDAVNPENASLDLNGVGLGYSDSYLYGTLSNVTGSWPTSGGILGPWFVYSLVVDNPDAGSDSLAFALVYANVPLIVQSGLYIVDARDTSYTRVADIDCVVDSGDLHLRCEFADLYAHPSFGVDNPSGYYNAGAGTGTVTLTNVRTLNDSTNVYAFYTRTEAASSGPNASPVLSDPCYEIASRDSRGVVVNLFVTYSDPDGHLPVERSVVVDGVPMSMGAGPDHDYTAGAQFTLEADLTVEDHVYYFSFSDGVKSVETEVDTIRLSTDVPDNGELAAVAVRSVWPQPARGEAHVLISLPRGATGSVEIFDIRGRLLRRLWSGTGGEHELYWDGRDGAGSAVASGVYLVKLASGASGDRAKLVLLR